MTEIKTEDANTIYLILDGSKTVDKASFLIQISELLEFPYYENEQNVRYFIKDWEELTQHLKTIVTTWEAENPNYIEPVSDPYGVLPRDLKVNVIWLDPLNFSTYNKADFLTVIDILKDITETESNPLTFVLASSFSNISREIFK